MDCLWKITTPENMLNWQCAYVLLLATVMPILHVHIIVGNHYANFACAYYCWQLLCQFYMCTLLLATLMPILHVHIIVGYGN